MRIKALISGLLESNTYIVTEKATTIVIDAGVSLDRLKRETGSVDAILLTHVHFDHIKNLRDIAKYYKCKIYIHEKGVDKLSDPNQNGAAFFGGKFIVDKSGLEFVEIKGGESLDIGNIKDIQVIGTPGHSECSVCYKIGMDLFSGDTIFMSGIGRCDIYDGDSVKMITSLKKLMKIKYSTLYPGHGPSGEPLSQKHEIQFKKKIRDDDM